MDNVVTVALSKVLKAAAVKSASADLTVGTHHVDAYVHVTGTIKKAEDEQAAPTVALSLLETLALTLKYSGVTGDAAKKAIRRAVTDSLTNNGASAGALTEEYPWLAEEIKDIKTEVISQLPAITKSGKVTTKLVVEELGDKWIAKL